MSQAPIDLIPHDYQSTLELLYGRINYEKSIETKYNADNYRLDRMRELLSHLGNPHQMYPIVHVAGTKGKGTTATLLYDSLRANDLRVGLYTSPHLVRLEERFRVDGSECSQQELVDLARQTFEAVRKIERDGWGSPTFFEVTTAIGFLHFARAKADCVVLEVGLGGRLDSTNVCQPVLCIITSISMDHQAQLGNSIEEIAREKAGIIKDSVPVICTARSPEACQVIEQVAGEQQAPFFLLNRDFAASWKAADQAWPVFPRTGSEAAALVDFSSTHLDLQGPLANSQWSTCMLGRHQADNLAGVITALAWLSTQAGWKIDAGRTRQSLMASRPEARLQILGLDPVRIIDTAHNPASISAGLQALEDHFPQRSRTVVFACSRDKEYRTMLKQILPTCNRLICTTFLTNPRAVEPEYLRTCAVEISEQLRLENMGSATIDCIASPEQAWQYAVHSSSKDSLVIAMGSFFLAAELLALHQ